MNKLLLQIVALSLVFGCAEQKKSKDDSFIFLEEHSYVVDNINGIPYYKLRENNKIMHGYYVIANDYGKSEELNLVNGVQQGVSMVFHNNNEVFSKTHYKNGKPHGFEHTYYMSGALNTKKQFENGIATGKFISYYETGQLSSESIIRDGETVESTSYDLLGNIRQQTFIEDSRTISQRIDHGRITIEHISSNYDDFEATKFYDDNGNMEVYLRFIKDDDYHVLVELDASENEIKRINLNENPEAVKAYSRFLGRL